MRRRLLLTLPALLLGACQDAPPTAPAGGAARTALVPAASILTTTGFHFLPPMVADPGPFTDPFDAARTPTVRVVCTGATGAACPVVAAFGGAGEPAISVDLEGESYGVVWQSPAGLALGKDLYRVEVRDGGYLLGFADLWVAAGRQELKDPGAYVGLVRGAPLQIKFRVERADPAFIPVFQSPFVVPFEVRTANYHDHDEPREGVDDNRVYLPWWGEPSFVGIDGHEGYDWLLPEGTPIVAVADGVVEIAGISLPYFCPPLGRIVDDQVLVRIDHDLPGGIRVRSIYVHLQQRTVVAGQPVTAGQVIGLSGNTGCSTDPHLHFAVERLTQTNDGAPSPIDPYGWAGAGPDPWESDPAGAASIRLWTPGQEPTLFRSRLAPLGETPTIFVQMTAVRFQGVRDDLNPNNEYVEVTRDARVAPAQLDLAGFTITTRAGLTFTFPAGTVLSAAVPSVRVYVGAGTDAPGVLHWGRTAGVFDNLAECVRFRNAAAVPRNTIGWGGGCL